jgi:hypothetical protein
MEKQIKHLPVVTEETEPKDSLLDEILSEHSQTLAIESIMDRIEVGPADPFVDKIQECITLYKTYQETAAAVDRGEVSFMQEILCFLNYTSKVDELFPIRIVQTDGGGEYVTLADGRKLRPACTCGKHSFCKIVSYRIE